ncbi:HAAS signaling domain-containing protein [Cellvibrio sp. OA-2007]|uniref:HAAS signaling domain-containing protein n=1 Tax=Cellvibrio sp. OA-2007 TaxID=529823 RepID=UPI0007845C55|nr:hypothetical protein [Cellvibrio sp. OA-2007]
MQLIDRYMSAVASYLPEVRRDEIVRELRANILDKLESLAEQQGREATEADVSALLKELGHPQQVASRFLPAQQLVTADLFPLYKQSLHYGVILVFILGLIQFAVGFLSSGYMDFIGLLHGFVMKGLITFAVITGLFYVFSNPPGGKPLFSPYQSWAPEKLPPVKRSWQRISGGEQGVDFASDLFFLLLLNYSFWMPSEKVSGLAAVFSDSVSEWVPLLSAVMIVSLLFGVWNMVYRYWTVPKLVIEALINLASAVILLKLSRLDQILVPTHNPLVEPVKMLELANHVIGTGLFWVGMWLLFMVGWSVYRIWQLSRTL